MKSKFDKYFGKNYAKNHYDFTLSNPIVVYDKNYEAWNFSGYVRLGDDLQYECYNSGFYWGCMDENEILLPEELSTIAKLLYV